MSAASVVCGKNKIGDSRKKGCELWDSGVKKVLEGKQSAYEE